MGKLLPPTLYFIIFYWNWICFLVWIWHCEKVCLDRLLFPNILSQHRRRFLTDEAIWSTSVYNISQQSLKFSKQSKVVEIWKSWKNRTPSFEKNNMNIFVMTNIYRKQKTINRNMWFKNLRCMIYTCSIMNLLSLI